MYSLVSQTTSTHIRTSPKPALGFLPSRTAKYGWRPATLRTAIRNCRCYLLNRNGSRWRCKDAAFVYEDGSSTSQLFLTSRFSYLKSKTLSYCLCLHRDRHSLRSQANTRYQKIYYPLKSFSSYIFGPDRHAVRHLPPRLHRRSRCSAGIFQCRSSFIVRQHYVEYLCFDRLVKLRYDDLSDIK